MRRTILGAAGGAVLALTAGHTLADAHPRPLHPPTATSAIDSDDAAAVRDEERAIALTNAASRAMERADRRCVLKLIPKTTYTHDAPSRALLDTFILLRRPAIPQDALLLPTGAIDGIAAEGVHVDWIRMGRASDGRENYLVTAQRPWLPPTLSRACVRLRHRLLVRMTRRSPARVRRLALRMDDQSASRKQQATARRAPGGEQVYSFSGGIVKGPGGGGSSTDLATFRRRGLFISEQPTLDDHSVVTGWLPDGVASVDVSYPSQVVRDPRRPATVYGEEIHLTIPAQDNLVSYEVDRPAEDALPPETVWRAADGSVIRVVRGQ